MVDVRGGGDFYVTSDKSLWFYKTAWHKVTLV